MNIKRIGLIGGSGVPVGGSSGTGSSITLVDNLESLSKSAALSANMGRELNETKAPKVGYAPDLKVNFANELVGRGDATVEEIGNIRPTGIRSIGDGNATIAKIKGKSVIWNQGVGSQNDVSKYQVFNCRITKTENGFQVNVVNNSNGYSVEALKLDGTHISTTKDHKYLISCDIRTEEVNKKIVFGVSTMESVARPDYSIAPVIQNTWRTYYVLTPSWIVNNQFGLVRIGGTNGENYTTSFEFKNMFLIDLTLMFGAGNEPTTIEEFEARKPLGVTNEYNEGTIVSFQGGDVKSVGFNAWDGVKAKVIGGQKYYLGGTYTSIGFSKEIDGELTTIVVPSDKIYTTSEDGYIYAQGTDICIHLVHSGYRNGDYEPYVEDVHPLPDIKRIKDSNGDTLFPYGLLSAGSVHDEITATKAIKRIGVVDMGSIKWESSNLNGSIYMSAYGNRNLIIRTIKATPNATTLANLMTIPYQVGPTTGLIAFGDKKIARNTNVESGALYVYDTDYTDATTFTEAMQGVLLYYELAEPIEVDLEEPLNMTYEAWDFGTEELVAGNATTPLNADIAYLFNAVDRIRENSTHIDEIKEITDNILGPISIGSYVNIEGNISITKSYGIDLGPDFVIQPNRIHIKGITDLDNIDITSEGIIIGTNGYGITIGKNTNIGNNIYIESGFDSRNISGGGGGNSLWNKTDTRFTTSDGSVILDSQAYGIQLKIENNTSLSIGTNVDIASQHGTAFNVDSMCGILFRNMLNGTQFIKISTNVYIENYVMIGTNASSVTDETTYIERYLQFSLVNDNTLKIKNANTGKYTTIELTQTE